MYTPRPFTGDVNNPEAVVAYVLNELKNIAQAEKTLLPQIIQFLSAAPPKYFDGLIVGADGSNWNPGAGKGVYCYYNSTWNKLG